MPFDWREFLLVAHKLRNDPSEGVQRTCLGRTYYYVYHLGLAEARALNFRGQVPGLHRKLWDWCQKNADPSIRRMGIDGVRMHSLRIDADYEDSPILNLAREVRTQLSRAQAFEALVARRKRQAPPSGLAT